MQVFISSGFLIDCKSAIASTIATSICSEATAAGSGLSVLSLEHGSATRDRAINSPSNWEFLKNGHQATLHGKVVHCSISENNDLGTTENSYEQLLL